MLQDARNYKIGGITPLRIDFTTSLVVNQQNIAVSPYMIFDPGFYIAIVDGVMIRFGVVQTPQVSLEGISFDGSTDKFWRNEQQTLPDKNIYDKSQSAWPLFYGAQYQIDFFINEPCFVSLYVDGAKLGVKDCPNVGRNFFSGVVFTRGRHKIELKVDVEP